MKHLTKEKIMIVLVILMLLIDAVLFVKVDKIGMKSVHNEYVSDGWKKEITKKTGDSEYFEDNKTVYRLVMSHRLTDEMKGKTLTFKTNDSFVDGYISSEPLDISESNKFYHYGNKYSYCDTPGTIYNFVDIPESDEQYITFRMETVYKNKFLTDYDIALGEQNELIYNYLHGELKTSIPNIIMLIFGILLIIISAIAKINKIPYSETASLGCLTISFALYANCPLFLNQYLVQHAAIQYYMYYFIYFLVPLFMYMYYETIVPNLKLKWIFYSGVLIEIILSIIHFSGIAAFTRTINIFNLYVGIAAISLIVMIVRRFKQISTINRISTITLLSFCLLNIIFYVFVSSLGNITFIARAGFLIYLVLAIFNGIKKIMENIYKERETNLLEQIAYTDNLTELGNRYALEKVVKSNDITKLSIVSMDLNYLKFTNDTFGHAAGDVLLKSAATALKSVYNNVYRVGGDEFIALVYDVNENDLEKLGIRLSEKVKSMNEMRDDFLEFANNQEFKLSIASGYSTYEKGDLSYEQIMQRADKVMYEKKRAHHQR